MSAAKPRIGWIGLGKMGAPMSRNLLKAGFPIIGYDIDEEKRKAIASAGGRPEESIAALARTADVVVSMIPDDGALRAVTMGANGVLENCNPGTIFIDMSTVSPEASKEVGEKAAGRNVDYLRAPVSGSTVFAVQGKLTIFVSGPKEAYSRCLPLFELLGAKISYVGGAEEARYLKILINMVLSTTAAIIGEALVLGKKGGIDWPTMIDQLSSSVVGSPLLGFKTQMLKERDFAPAFTAEQMIKDLDIMLAAGRTANTPLPIIALVRQLYGAMAATGKGQLDYFGILLLMEELAGL